MTTVEEQPLGAAEVDTLFEPYLGAAATPSTLVLAVSGGVDSMALMHLAADAVRRAGRGRILVATVDHALRAESAAEARFVVDAARRIGLEAAILLWQGPKPATGIQAAARLARYGLLGELCRAERAQWLVTAHTLDDQAETFLLRLARGSGVEGLSAMAPVEPFEIAGDRLALTAGSADARASSSSLAICRPFLAVPKSRLVATMRARGLAWIEDPSNDNPAFERVRIRRAMPLLAELGLTSAALARSARRLRSVREAITEATLRALGDPALVRIDPLGFATIDRRAWLDPEVALPEAVQLRLLSAVVRMVGGAERPLSLASMEDVARCIAAIWRGEQSASYATTIGHTRIEAGREGVRVVREAGRRPPPPATLKPGQSALWDNRFLVHVTAVAPRALEVRALGDEGAAALASEGYGPPSLPAGVLASVPAFYDGARRVAVPSLAAHWRLSGAEPAAAPLTAIEGPCVATFRDARRLAALAADD